MVKYISRCSDCKDPFEVTLFLSLALILVENVALLAERERFTTTPWSLNGERMCGHA